MNSRIGAGHPKIINPLRVFLQPHSDKHFRWCFLFMMKLDIPSVARMTFSKLAIFASHNLLIYLNKVKCIE